MQIKIRNKSMSIYKCIIKQSDLIILIIKDLEKILVTIFKVIYIHVIFYTI